MIFTLDWAKKRNACEDAVAAFSEKFGQQAEVREVVEWLCSIHELDWLAWVLSQGDKDVAIKFLREGADVPSVQERAMELAVLHGRLEVVKFFVERGVDIHAPSNCLLRSAAINDRFDVVQFLIEKGSYSRLAIETAVEAAVRMSKFEIASFLRRQLYGQS